MTHHRRPISRLSNISGVPTTACRSIAFLAICGLTSSILLASGSFALAQEAARQDVATQTAATQNAVPQPAPATPACSGIFCLFKQGGAPRAEPAAQPTPVASPDATPADDAPSEPARAVKAKPAKPTITIAADRGEIVRLKSLATLLPKEKIRVVTGAREPADFTVTTSLAAPAGIEKARLFTEQMHIVAGPGIGSIADLRDKVVSFGPDKSMSQAAARSAFAAIGVSVKETPLDVDNALDGVSTGDVAAVVLLAPQPVSRLTSLSGLHLVSWPEAGPMPAGAVSASIDGSAYPGLAKPGETIRAMGVDAVLALSPASARKPAAKSFLADLSHHSDALSRHGFDLIKADLETRSTRRVASAERR